MDSLIVNAVLRLDHGALSRVLWLDELAIDCWLIDIASSSAAPKWASVDDILEAMSRGIVQPADDPWLSTKRADGPSPAQIATRDRNWAIIERLVGHQPAIFDPTTRARLIAGVSIETGASRSTLYRLIRRWWQRGMTPNALLADYANCGGKGKSKTGGVAKRGRPSTYAPPGVNVSEAMRHQMKAAVNRYAVKGKMNLTECYKDFQKHYYTSLDHSESPGFRERKRIVAEKIPTKRQFRYWFEKDNDTFSIDRRRRTPRVYDKSHRALLGTASGEVYGPGARYLIDATIVNVYLRSRFNEFTALMIVIVLYYNNKHQLPNFELDPEMIAEDVSSVPIEMWEWGIARRSGKLVSFPEDHVKLCLLPRASASVTEHGLAFEGCYFGHKDSHEKHHWFERAQQRRRWTVDISYDPFCLNSIWLREPDRGFLACNLLARSEPYRDRSLWEIEQLRGKRKRNVAEHERTEIAGWSELDDRMEDIVSAARRKRSSHDPSRSAKPSGIPRNKAAEKIMNRRKFVGNDDRAEGRGADSSDTVAPFPKSTPDQSTGGFSDIRSLRSFLDESPDQEEPSDG